MIFDNRYNTGNKQLLMKRTHVSFIIFFDIVCIAHLVWIWQRDVDAESFV